MFNMLRRWLAKDDKREHAAAFVLTIGTMIALFASLVLSLEALTLAKMPNATLSCDVNTALSCSGVARHWSAELLGFPNALIGLATLPVMVTIGVALLARTKFPRWFMLAAQAGAVAGLLFAAWMLYMSVFEIRILCPWCLTTDVGMLLIFYGLTRHNILTGVISDSKLKEYVRKDYDTLALAVAIVLILVTILWRFSGQLF